MFRLRNCLTVQEVAAEFHVHRNTVDRWRIAGYIHAIRHVGRWWFERVEVKRVDTFRGKKGRK